MRLPNSPISKALSNPREAYNWIRTNLGRAIIEDLFTRFYARNPFDYNWDVLVVLDACRYDIVNDSYPTVWGTPERVISLGWGSRVWLERIFGRTSEDILSETVYISANPFSHLATEAPLQDVDEVWRYAFDENLGTTTPQPLTDRAIQYSRSNNPKRLIIHYMQPHLPPLDEAVNFGLDSEGVGWTGGGNPWVQIESGEQSPESIAKVYRDNLLSVVQSVELLLKNINADTVVITSDHGNYLGENGNWGHHKRFSWDTAVRAVPWWETTAQDEQTYEPDGYNEKQNIGREEQLKALGYV